MRNSDITNSRASQHSRLNESKYSTVDEFVLDLRRIAANYLQFNSNIDDRFRPNALEFHTFVEDHCKIFIAEQELPKVVYPSLLYCWSDCVNVLDELINMKNPEDEQQTAFTFLHPVRYLCGGAFPEGYTEKVKKPLDFGTIVQELLTGHYYSVEEFAADCRQVIENCRKYYTGDDELATFIIETADRISSSMEKNLDNLRLLDESDKGAKERRLPSRKGRGSIDRLTSNATKKARSTPKVRRDPLSCTH